MKVPWGTASEKMSKKPAGKGGSGVSFVFFLFSLGCFGSDVGGCVDCRRGRGGRGKRRERQNGSRLTPYQAQDLLNGAILVSRISRENERVLGHDGRSRVM